MWWPFKKREEYIRVPKWWAQELAQLSYEAIHSMGFDDGVKSAEVVGFASNIKDFIE